MLIQGHLINHTVYIHIYVLADILNQCVDKFSGDIIEKKLFKNKL